MGQFEIDFAIIVKGCCMFHSFDVLFDDSSVDYICPKRFHFPVEYQGVSGTVGGKTSKTLVLPRLSKIEGGSIMVVLPHTGERHAGVVDAADWSQHFHE